MDKAPDRAELRRIAEAAGAQLRPRDELLAMLDDYIAVTIIEIGPSKNRTWLNLLSEAAERIRADTGHLAALEAALEQSESAMREYYRYQTGGETRGSYDGKPERAGLWKAMNAARQALARLKETGHGG